MSGSGSGSARREWVHPSRCAINSRGLVFSTHFATHYNFPESKNSGSRSLASYKYIKTKADYVPFSPVDRAPVTKGEVTPSFSEDGIHTPLLVSSTPLHSESGGRDDVVLRNHTFIPCRSYVSRKLRCNPHVSRPLVLVVVDESSLSLVTSKIYRQK